MGIEGGASKTEGILIDDLGKVHVTLQSGPSNPWVRRKKHSSFISGS